MDVSYENAFIDKLIKKAIYPLKSSVYNNTENYIFMTEKYRINDILKIAGNDVYIKKYKGAKGRGGCSRNKQLHTGYIPYG
ncbi:hypothetical protein [Acidiplasma cupricumulans]|uniref:hypothetical protein n=1 Tax=Acidiplasma cupricumulans TaxID=312540 RepID=UPI0015849F18|nr:hypothetical protein [Acidiplasma cupricumulans]